MHAWCRKGWDFDCIGTSRTGFVAVESTYYNLKYCTAHYSLGLEIEVSPHEYVARLSENKHIMLLYDDPRYAREIEAIFIANGLQKGECCIYVSHDGHAFEPSALEPLGIDGKKCIKDGTLHLMRIGEFTGKSDNKMSLQKLVRANGSKARLVGRWVTDVSTVDGVSSELDLEREIHSVFHKFPGSILCAYQMDSICKTDRADWAMKIMNNHHSVMMLTGEKDGTVHEF